MYTIRRDIGYECLTGRAVSPEELPGGWARAEWAVIDRYPWDETGYTPEARAALTEKDGGLCGMMLAREETISGTVTETDGGVCVDSCLECFLMPFPDDARYINIEINCLGTAHIAVGEGRHGRQVFKTLPEGVQISASLHEKGWWGVSFLLPASLLAALYGGRSLTAGAELRGNFYTCDETIHPHFGTWSPVSAPAPDFHRPECFGTLRIGLAARRHIRRDEWTGFHGVTYARLRTRLRGREIEAQRMRIGSADEPFAVPGPAGRLVVGDAGYSWLQIAPKGECWWMTAMYDAGGRLLQYYFDVTDGNSIGAGKDCHFVDLYLDLVLRPDGSLETLDRDELEAALSAGQVTKAQYDRALQTERTLRESLNADAMREFDAIFARLCALPLKTWEALE